MNFGFTVDKAKDARAGKMSDPYAYQRRTPLERAFEPIQARIAREFPRREARGDLLPIRGFVRFLSDGTPGGRPVDPPRSLMAELRNSAMPARAFILSNKERKRSERIVRASRFIAKDERVTLLQTSKPRALDAARSFRGRPAVHSIGKPAPPANYQGGFTRVFERNRAFPKDTSISMKPVSTIGTRWQTTSLPTYSGSSDARARLPKTL